MTPPILAALEFPRSRYICQLDAVWLGSSEGEARERVLESVERTREPPVWMNQSQVLGGLEGDKEGRGWGGVEVVEVVRRRWKRVGTALAVRVGTRVVRIAWVRSQFEVRRGRRKREKGSGRRFRREERGRLTRQPVSRMWKARSVSVLGTVSTTHSRTSND